MYSPKELKMCLVWFFKLHCFASTENDIVIYCDNVLICLTTVGKEYSNHFTYEIKFTHHKKYLSSHKISCTIPSVALERSFKKPALQIVGVFERNGHLGSSTLEKTAP